MLAFHSTEVPEGNFDCSLQDLYGKRNIMRFARVGKLGLSDNTHKDRKSTRQTSRTFNRRCIYPYLDYVSLGSSPFSD